MSADLIYLGQNLLPCGDQGTRDCADVGSYPELSSGL